MSIPIVGKCFVSAREFLAYLDAIQFGAWRPRYVVMHHTGAPDLKTWQGWQTRPKPVSDPQWMQNLKGYYESLGWQRAPQFFFTPKHYCVLSLPTVRGTHAVSFNANSWGVECVGDFDREPFDGPVREQYVEGLACLHIAAGLQLAPFERGVRGLHFHRDDPKTSKTCPGNHVDKAKLIVAVQDKIDDMTGGDHPEEHIEPPALAATRRGMVNTDDLSVRAGASAKMPVLRMLNKGSNINIIGETMNGDTRWLNIAVGEWVAARFVTVS